MYNSNSSPSLNNCVFTEDSALLHGGGLYNFSSSPMLTNCTFSGNINDTRGGGGIENFNSSPTLFNCTLTGNSVGEFSDGVGSGMLNSTNSSPMLTNCILSNNIGCAIASFSSSIQLTNCVLNNNRAIENSSGGVCGGIFNESSSATLTNCIFTGNQANIAGGAIYNDASSLKVIDCTFAGNSAGFASGIYDGGSKSLATLINCTFSDNVLDPSASSGNNITIYHAGGTLTLANCVLWDNTGAAGDQIVNQSGTLSVTYSDIQGSFTGTGNINADPVFVRNPSAGADGVWSTADDDYGNLQLKAGSPAVDAGSNAAVPSGTTTDLAGNNRFIDIPGVRDPGAIVDMGAFEQQLPLLITSGSFLYNAPQPTLNFVVNNAAFDDRSIECDGEHQSCPGQRFARRVCSARRDLITIPRPRR